LSQAVIVTAVGAPKERGAQALDIRRDPRPTNAKQGVARQPIDRRADRLGEQFDVRCDDEFRVDPT
jgi:hypothetical protein